jgi:hypothetical protein
MGEGPSLQSLLKMSREIDALNARIDRRRLRLIVVAAMGVFVQPMRSAVLLATVPSAS